MNLETQKQLDAALTELRQLYPQWRLGQAIANAAAWAGKDRPLELWDVEDEQLLQAIREHLASRRARTAKSA